MNTVIRRCIVLMLAVLALGGAAAPASAAGKVIYVDDDASNNHGVSCPNPAGTTIQAGVAAAGTGNATIYVCEGTYSETVTIADMGNLKLVARGNVKIDAPLGLTGPLIHVATSTNVTIQGFFINGQGGLGNATTTAIFVDSSSAAILNNTILNWTQGDISATTATAKGIVANNLFQPDLAVKIDHNTIYDFQNGGIEVDYAGGSSVTHNRLVVTSGGNFAPTAIAFNYSTGGSISGNSIDSTFALGNLTQGHGIYLHEVSSVKVSANTITRMANGITLESICSFGDTHKNTISGSKISEASAGITLSASYGGACTRVFDATTISGNKVSVTYGDSQAAVYLAATSAAQIAGTIIKDNTFAGYYYNPPVVIFGSAPGTVQSGNTQKYLPSPGF